MSTLGRIVTAACRLCLFTLLERSSSGAQVPDADWLTYNRTLPGDRISPLKEINPSNVAHLKAICTYTLPEVSSLQTGLLVVDGTMYFTTDEGSYAIDASTCAEKWKQHRHSDTPSMLLVNRGFAYANGRLFRGASDSHVLAMDPADAHVLWDQVIDAQGPGGPRAATHFVLNDAEGEIPETSRLTVLSWGDMDCVTPLPSRSPEGRTRLCFYP